MKKTDGGRICDKCSKTIVDFRKYSWNEIIEKQNKYENSLCGIYTKAQLDNWGHEISSQRNYIERTAVLTGLSILISLTTLSQNKTIITGTVSTQYYSSEGLKKKPLNQTSLTISNTNRSTITDDKGEFILELANSQIDSNGLEIEISKDGYAKEVIRVEQNPDNNDTITINASLLPILIEEPKPTQTVYYVAEPTLMDTIKDSIDKLKKD